MLNAPARSLRADDFLTVPQHCVDFSLSPTSSLDATDLFLPDISFEGSAEVRLRGAWAARGVQVAAFRLYKCSGALQAANGPAHNSPPSAACRPPALSALPLPRPAPGGLLVGLARRPTRPGAPRHL